MTNSARKRGWKKEWMMLGEVGAGPSSPTMMVGRGSASLPSSTIQWLLQPTPISFLPLSPDTHWTHLLLYMGINILLSCASLEPPLGGKLYSHLNF